MAISNHERVGKTLELLKDGLTPFVEGEYQDRYGADWRTRALQVLSRDRIFRAPDGGAHFDVSALIQLMLYQWNEVFAGTLSPAERCLVSELREVRNRWAHQHAFSTEDAYRALDTTYRLLTAIGAAEKASAVDAQRKELLQLYCKQSRTSGRSQPGPTGIPPADRAEIEQALADFDRDLRHLPEWDGWHLKHNFKYAIKYQDQLYPPKQIIRMATGATNFLGGAQANTYLSDRGFDIVDL
jgi:hypothetical protein